MHGGAMDVQSNADPNAADRGTTFTLRVPLVVSGEGRKLAGAARVEVGHISTEAAGRGPGSFSTTGKEQV